LPSYGFSDRILLANFFGKAAESIAEMFEVKFFSFSQSLD
jgi:hypothetical protein